KIARVPIRRPQRVRGLPRATAKKPCTLGPLAGCNSQFTGANGIMTEYLLYAVLAVGVAISISSIDDLIVDWLCFRTARKHPHTLRVPPPQEGSKPRPRIGVFVANWHEADVLGRMVEGNLANITYKPFIFVLGVYPNDVDTLRIAK